VRPLPRSAAITGIGVSQIGRRLGVDGLTLAIQATLRAIADAGLSPGKIDGLACWPGRMSDGSGSSPVGIWDLKEALGLGLSWYAGGVEGPAQLSSVLNAVLAVSSGHARHVLCFRSSTEGSARVAASSGATDDAQPRIEDASQWLLPSNALSLANYAALAAQRHMHRFGTTREHLAWIALNGRRNASLNPDAIYRAPLTLDDYMAARMISTPLSLYDCDVPVDGAIAVVVSAADAAADTRVPPIWIEAISGALRGRALWDHWDPTDWAGIDAAHRLWSMTELQPADIDFAQLYDGFSIVALMWLEALGFCAPGESGDFIERGTRIARDGALPLNTCGGQLSAGRLHGLGLLHEAVLQLRGEAAARQLPQPARIAAVSNGAGPIGACMLLVRD